MPSLVYFVNDPIRVILGLTAIGALMGWYGASHAAWRTDAVATETQQATDESMEQARRMSVLTELRDHYRMSNPEGVTFELAQGWPPEAWMNMQLAQRGETWWVTLDEVNIEWSK